MAKLKSNIQAHRSEAIIDPTLLPKSEPKIPNQTDLGFKKRVSQVKSESKEIIENQ